MHKKAALTAVLTPLYFTEKLACSNNVINACNVKEHLFGKLSIIAFCFFSTGSNYGWLKTILYGNYANYLDTALLRLPESRITGLIRFQRMRSITLRSSI
jgi:hypothetical protein